MKAKKLGYWQVEMLSKITSKGVGCRSIMGLKGKALDYLSVYVQRLHSAIEAHNKGIAINSPIDSAYYIQVGNYGSKGGYGFRAVPKIFL